MRSLSGKGTSRPRKRLTARSSNGSLASAVVSRPGPADVAGRTPHEATELISTWANAQTVASWCAGIEMAWIQRENGNLSSRQSLYHSLAASPNNPIATAQLGQLYQDMGQSDRAAVMFRRSLQADWMQPQVQSRLATLQNPNGYAGAAGMMFRLMAPSWRRFPSRHRRSLYSRAVTRENRAGSVAAE